MSLSAKRVNRYKLRPMSLVELDEVAGGLNDSDQNRIAPDASQMTQVADGAAAADAQQADAQTGTPRWSNSSTISARWPISPICGQTSWP